MIAIRILRNVFVASLLAFTTHLGSASADSKPGFVDVPAFASTFEQALVQGIQSTSQVLNRLGPDVQQALRDAQEKTDFQYYNFSARSQIEMLYQRAEAGGAGQGNLFLARLKDDLAKNSAAIADNPKLKFLDAVPRQRGPISFAPLATLDDRALARQLSPAVDEAVTILSEHTSSKGIGHARSILIRHLNFDRSGTGKQALQELDSIMRNALSVKGVLAAALLAHAPPPKVQTAVQNIILDFASSSGAFAVDPAVGKVMNNLSGELTLAEQRLVKGENTFQAAHDPYGELPKPTLDLDSEKKFVSAISKGAEAAPEPFGTAGGAGVGLPFPQARPKDGGHLTQKHQRYVEASFESKGPRESIVPPPAWAPTRSSPVTRTYHKAILSARAARGVAVGADMKDGVGRIPLNAYWVADKSNDRFGRLVVALSACKENWLKWFWQLLRQCDGNPLVAVSNRLHTDSFMAANQLLWGTHNVETRFSEGEITVLMSMNPWTLPEAAEAVLKEKELLIVKYNRLVISYRAAVRESAGNVLSSPKKRAADQFNLDIQDTPKRPQPIRPNLESIKTLETIQNDILSTKSEIEAVDQKFEKLAKTKFRFPELPKSIVFHPAIQGRALAWSTARIDFWFNDSKRLFEEANSIALDDSTAIEMRRVLEQSKRDANTWQFFEQDGTVETSQSDSTTTLVVRSPHDQDAGSDGRFGVSLFQVEGNNEDQARRSPEKEAAIRKPLAWLQRSHPDFWRLSDFSTSLMLLRYLKSHQIQLISFSPDDFEPKYPTPEWIFGNEVVPVAKL